MGATQTFSCLILPLPLADTTYRLNEVNHLCCDGILRFFQALQVHRYQAIDHLHLHSIFEDDLCSLYHLLHCLARIRT
ncbi:unnamed protein product [Haemonchus placei]|uniref:Uncharacterized protein n=1 Tax=Haemonchus placei TaxID=6290 RepID=A0A3P7WBK7_HAEPC|nr:unnamed protein product [Haemonchus placei]